MDLTPRDDRPAERRQHTSLGGEPPVTAEGISGIPHDPPDYSSEGYSLAGEAPAALTDAELAAKLEGIGRMLNRLHHPEGAPDLWLFTESELEAIAGPASRELNKRGDRVRAVLERLDLLAVIVGLGSYIGRQLETLRQLREAGAEPGAEPDDDGEPEHVGPEGFGLADLEGMPR